MLLAILLAVIIGMATVIVAGCVSIRIIGRVLERNMARVCGVLENLEALLEKIEGKL